MNTTNSKALEARIAQLENEVVQKNRELEIGVALEKVATVAMAMTTDDSLVIVCETLYKELKQLGLENIRNAQAGIIDEEKKIYKEYSYSYSGSSSIGKLTKYTEDPLSNELVIEMQKSKDAFFKKQLSGEEFEKWRKWRIQSRFPDDPLLETTSSIWFYYYSVGSGGIGISTFDAITEDQQQLLKRFRNVFELSFQRFLDLRQAEAQSREAKIEAALERVRTRTLAMQKSEELVDTSIVVFQELKNLGLKAIRTGVAIIDENETLEFWSSQFIEDKQNKVHGVVNMNVHPFFEGLLRAWRSKESSYTHEMNGDEVKKYYEVLSSAISYPRQDKYNTREIFNSFLFSAGAVSVVTHEHLTDEERNIMHRSTNVFGGLYRRFLDLQKAELLAKKSAEDLIALKEEKKRTEDALTELKATQSQLIQSEKMASLGELTAGIAHEIQNPLNFVNNFSDVNTELIDELAEHLQNGDWQRAKELSQNLKENEQKIQHHGKRAEDIVKSMLQHSRLSSGQKELTDINALVDEYTRLAYHGFRAKNKNFNATLNTDFTEGIGSLNVVRQEIGRVILNLLGNAFYAVADRQKTDPGNYKPSVAISTKKINSHVEISIKDNGNGIPKDILKKIFQPFFTTKPTGLGTGLGLSLSYDIIKSHDGHLDVRTVEGEFSDFIIRLPLR